MNASHKCFLNDINLIGMIAKISIGFLKKYQEISEVFANYSWFIVIDT